MSLRIASKVTGLDNSDIIIPIMGSTGVGKSAFVNAAANMDATTVSHDLESCTKEISIVPIPFSENPTRRVILVDTPGFDDTWLPDTEILRRIAEWLERSYRTKKRLSGIIYLHDISRTRMLGSALRNLEMFKGLCGDDGISNVILVTTKWSEVEESVGQRREQDLANVYWRGMLDQGSEMARFLGSPSSAWDIINSIVKKMPVIAVQIQKELVDLRKKLCETKAAIALRRELETLLEEQRARARALKENSTPETRAGCGEVDKRIRWILSQIQELSPLSQKLKTFFSLT